MTPEALDRILAATAGFTEPLEGFKSKPYLDSCGVATIGCGSTLNDDGTKVTLRTPPITEAQAQARMATTYRHIYANIAPWVKVDLTDNEWVAILDFSYNAGEPAFHGSSVLSDINAKRFAAVPAAFALWNKGHVKGQLVVINGLVNRRKAEIARFIHA